jgi:hypothetical protein
VHGGVATVVKIQKRDRNIKRAQKGEKEVNDKMTLNWPSLHPNFFPLGQNQF